MELVNAHDVKNVPGRKTDVSDAAWLADLGAHGLFRASSVPPEAIRQLRDLTRARMVLTQERSREVQRLEKLLEDAGVKLSSVASDITVGVRPVDAGRSDRWPPGPRGACRVGQGADAIQGTHRDEGADRALHRPSRVHGPTVPGPDRRPHRQHQHPLDPDQDADGLFSPGPGAAGEPIPGFSQRVAEVFIAETGADMSMFPTTAHLASWAGTNPGSHESAGRFKSTKTRPGNHYLKGALGVAALAASCSKDTYLSARYRRIATRRGPMKALDAPEHSMLIAAWNMLSNDDLYRDPGADYFTRRVPTTTKARAIAQLEALGYHVDLQPLAATA